MIDSAQYLHPLRKGRQIIMVKKAKQSLARSSESSSIGVEATGADNPRLYTLKVHLMDDRKKFAPRRPRVYRIIQIRGNQTLESLHFAIFNAYDRHDEHLYDFHFGEQPMDPKGRRYVLPMANEGFGFKDDDRRIAGIVDETTIDSIGLKVGQHFGYRFDFGDNWWHQISVEAIEANAPPGNYPSIIKRVGPSPSQYFFEDEQE
jgi:hypothetical protein